LALATIWAFGIEKLECLGYPMVKNFEDIFIRFGAPHKRDRQTDRQTDIARQKLSGLRLSYITPSLQLLCSDVVDSQCASRPAAVISSIAFDLDILVFSNNYDLSCCR